MSSPFGPSEPPQLTYENDNDYQIHLSLARKGKGTDARTSGKNGNERPAARRRPSAQRYILMYGKEQICLGTFG